MQQTNSMPGFEKPVNAQRPPISLYPSPGKLHGSRKRKSDSRHGPLSASYDQSTNMVIQKNEVKQIESQDSVKAELGDTIRSSCSSSPDTPTLKGMKPFEMRVESPVFNTPKSNDNYTFTPCSMSPLSREMSTFRHLSIRSPKLSKSPCSSFSQYTKSVHTLPTATLNSQNSFESSDISRTASVSSNITSTPNNLKTVPLTVLSDSRNPGDPRNDTRPSLTKRPPLKSPNLILSPRPHRPSKYLQSPWQSCLSFPPIPPRDDTDTNLPLVSIEKPGPPGGSLTYKNVEVSPMVSLSNCNSNNMDQTMKTKPSSPPPIKFLSVNLNDKNSDSKKNLSNLKRRTTINPAISLLKPSSEEALNEMLYSQDGDTDGSLSDSDDEGGFFLSDPRTLSLQPRSYEDSNKVNSDNDECHLSLTAAYSFMGSNKKKRNASIGILCPNLTSSADPKLSENSKNNNPPFGLEKDRTSSTSLFGMNIIHEHSVSNASLAETISSFGHQMKRSSSRNLSDDVPKDSTFLNRSKSNQSMNSLGLCLENFSHEGLDNGRDMITPPVISRPLTSPPPLKQTALTFQKLQ